MHHEVVTQIYVDAPPERLWEVLMDWESFPQWNPFVRRLEGHLGKGERLLLTVHLPQGRTLRLKPEVRFVRQGREVGWSSHLWLPGLLEGEYQFNIEPVDTNRSLLVQRERFHGFLVPVLWPSLKRTVRSGFMLMNAALKGRIELYGREHPE